MATDFFERQDAARRATKWLVVGFSVYLVGMVLATMAAVWLALASFGHEQPSDVGRQFHLQAGSEDVALTLAAGGLAFALISGGSAFKILQLRGGGHVVAENLGARRIFPDTTDPVERRVLNVVEEMALASGVPVPPTFILPEEKGINAFAAGYAPSDAVVAVTRGSAEQLSREQLQGVVAHEFSHILNGDMRLNIRLIGILNGVLILGLIGRIMLRMMMYSGPRRSSRDNKGGGAVLAFALFGLALMIIGLIGTIVGNLMKAAVSRQREYLADASAVQFTRNPEGLAGALKRIGAFFSGSKLKAPNAAEASHMFFVQGVWEGFTGLTATHPPLPARILRLDPQWDGVYPPVPDVPAAIAEAGEQAAGLVGAVPSQVPVAVVARAVDQVADPHERHRKYAAALIESLPPAVRQAAREPYGARAVLFGLLTDRNESVRAKQLAQLQESATPDVYELTLKLLPVIDGLDVRARLPLVDLSLPALRAMSPAQYREFIKCFKELVAADNRLGLFEWTLHRVLLRHLTPQYERTAAARPAASKLQATDLECSILLSTLAYADNRIAEAPTALERGAACLPGLAIRLLPPDQCGLTALSGALDVLKGVPEKLRRHVVNACAACICADQDVTVAEAEMFRGVCDMLDCPMPPLLPGGPATPGTGEAA